MDVHHTGTVGLLEEETLRHMSDEMASQRRHLQFHTGETVVQVGPEPAVAHQTPEALVRRHNYADVDPPGLLPADAFDSKLLHGSEQLGLRWPREIGYLVQEQRIPIGRLELCRSRIAGGGWRSSTATPRPASPRPRAAWHSWPHGPPGGPAPSWRPSAGRRGSRPSSARWR